MATAKKATQRQGFKTNEFVVYPAHGVGQISSIEEQEVAGHTLELFVISFQQDKLILRVPVAKAASAGMRKLAEPVLVEKAFTRNAVEAAQIVDEARSRRLLCMEAMWSRFLPHYDVVRQLIETGRLGSVRTLTADHGQRLWPEGPQRLSDPGLAGGALLDLGIYPVSFAHMVLGGLQHVRAVGTLTDAGVDATTSIVATGRDGAHALLSTTMGARTPTTATISGDLGRIEIDGDFYMPNTVRLLDSGGAELERWEYDLGTRHFGLRFEAAEAARCLHVGALESPLLPLDETLSVMRTLDEVRAQIGVHYPGE